MMDAAMEHDGFSFIECLSECVEFFPGAFDSSNPRKGGIFNLVPKTHDVTDEVAAYKLADEPFPGFFGVFRRVNRSTKNAREAELNAAARQKVTGLKDWQILKQSFDQVK
jgi:2-oxoglutarate ferredoxin oxidoreductase subunit beta